MPVTAKIALSNLKGSLAIAKAHKIELAREGVDSDNSSKQVEVLEYAIAAVSALALRRKSAFKELARAQSDV